MKTQKFKTKNPEYTSITLALEPNSSICTQTLFDLSPSIRVRWAVVMEMCWHATLVVYRASMVDEGEGGCCVDVLTVLRWFVEERERDGDKEDKMDVKKGRISGF